MYFPNLKLPPLHLIGSTAVLSVALLVPVHAATIANCSASNTVCSIPENVLVQLPFTAIAGDAVLADSDNAVSDVFRIFNNFINTGSGTGLGYLAEMYSADNIAVPTTFSANAVFLPESPSGITTYTSSGKTYLLGVPEPQSFGLLSVASGLLLLLRRKRARLFGKEFVSGSLTVALLCCAAAHAQSLDPVDGPVSAQINLNDGPVPVMVSLHLPVGAAAGQDQAVANASALFPGLSFHSASLLALGSTLLPFNIVGLDPLQGASTTTIPTVIVPMRFVFPGDGNPTLDGMNVVAAVITSPIFQNADYKAGSVDLGVTQYGDALLRAEFWNAPGFSQDYHVLLGQPSVQPTVTITVPVGLGTAYLLSNGTYQGVVDTSFFESTVAGLAASYQASQLPIFLTDNVNLGTGGLMTNCCIVGYHSSQGPPATTARTWIYAAYEEPGTFNGSQIGLSWVDVVPLSHEIAEWLNDPFVGGFTFGFLNFVPPAALSNGSCAINFETGDPLESAPFQGTPNTFSKVTNSISYHLQDEVLLPWYLHTTPSFSANEWYTFQNISAQVPLVLNAPLALAGSISDTATMLFAPVNTPATADVVYVGRGCPVGSIGPGSPADPYLADPTGKLVLIDRGSCAISLKIDAAAQAGAAGVLIGLVAPGNAMAFSYGGGTSFVPSLTITQTTSNAIKAALASSNVNATISPDNAIPAPYSQLCGVGGPG